MLLFFGKGGGGRIIKIFSKYLCFQSPWPKTEEVEVRPEEKKENGINLNLFSSEICKWKNGGKLPDKKGEFYSYKISTGHSYN